MHIGPCQSTALLQQEGLLRGHDQPDAICVGGHWSAYRSLVNRRALRTGSGGLPGHRSR